MEKHAEQAFELIRELQQMLMTHTADENRIFSTALKQMQPHERRKLLDEMQKI
jgi:hypothetical protein